MLSLWSLLFAAASAQLIQLPAQCALLLVFNFDFNFQNVTNINVTARSLNWVPDSSGYYLTAATNQVISDLAATIPGTQVTSYIGAGASSSSGQFMNIQLGLCDTILGTEMNQTAMAIENALLLNNSALKVRSPSLWNYYIADNFAQFTFEMVWGPRVKDAWNDVISPNDILGAFQAMLATSDQPRLTIGFHLSFGIPFIGYRSALDLNIDGQSDTPYTGNLTRYDVYTVIRNAILNASSTLRTTNPYFKLWITPCSFSGAESMRPIWALPLVLLAFLGS